MSDDAALNSAHNIMRRMPPAQTENSLAGLIELRPDLTEDLLSNIDQPLKVEKDSKSGKFFVKCDYNRDADSYRSPWSNQYFPPLDDGFLPSDRLRDMEKAANTIFDQYRKLYFEGGYSSVYFFDTDDDSAASNSFGACFLIHKDVDNENDLKAGWWDSVHVFEVEEKKANTFSYKLTTTVMISMKLESGSIGVVDLSGNMTKQTQQTHSVSSREPHIHHMGTMLEKMELDIRNNIEGIYIQKTRQVINGMRSTQDNANKEAAFGKIMESLAARSAHTK
jgi:capping protein beta